MAVKVPKDDLLIENAQIMYRNFAGNEGVYNKKGERNFSVRVMTIEEAQAIEALGWKVNYPKPREDGEPRDFAATLPVHVKYHPRLAPPRVKLLKRGGQVTIDEEAVDMMDFVDIEKVDLMIRPFHWKQPTGAEGIKNMCSSIYITVREDALELKYGHLRELGMNDSDQLAIESGEDVWEDLGEVAQNRAIEAGF